MSQNTPIKVTRWQRWRIVFYGLLVIALFLLGVWGYSKYREQQEWALIDQMLVEEDAKHPHWRWYEFQPKPLQSGQVNGALRFIEIGKQLTDEMLTGTDYPGDDALNFKPYTKEWLTTIDRESVKSSGRMIREQCKHLELEIPKLVELLPGCPPFYDGRLSVEDVLAGNGEKQQPLIQFSRSRRWLVQLTKFHVNEGSGDLAIQAWRATLASELNNVPGFVFFLRQHGYLWAFDRCYQLLSRTEPSEPALRELQQTIRDWQSRLVSLDDISMDRALEIQLLLERKEKKSSAFLTTLRQVYATPPKWMPQIWVDWTSSLGVGSPSLPYICRMEVLSNFRLFDEFERQLSTGKPYLNLKAFEDDNALPGQLLAVFSMPRWRKILVDIAALHENLICMEAIIASERYRLKHGKFPGQWSDVVPSLLENTPTYFGKPYVLKHVPEGLVIYGIGHKDFGGKVLRTYDEETNKSDQETDQGLMIFYPQYRRQPPPPVKPKAKSEEP